MDYTSARDSTNALNEHLRRVHKSFAGAQFRIAFYKMGNSWQFLTGAVIFQPSKVASREAADYGSLLFVEQWCQDQSEAHGLLWKLLSGQAEIEGHKITCTFHRSRFEDYKYPRDEHQWSGLRITSMRDRDANFREPSIPQGAVVGFDLPPYLGPNHAVSDWIFGGHASNPASATVPDENSIVTIVPDTRARIISARWTPGKLRIKTEINIPNMQVQIVHVDSEPK